jgi:hypothetical protein
MQHNSISSSSSQRETMAAVASSRPASSAYSPSQQDPGTPTQQPAAIIVDRTNNKQYVRGRFLGKGGFAKCYELTDVDTNQLFAGKIVAKATLTKHRAKEKVSEEGSMVCASGAISNTQKHPQNILPHAISADHPSALH